MQVVRCILKCQAFSWNVAAGDNGNPGGYPAPIQLPLGSVVKYITTNTTVPFTSATNSATITLGFSKINPIGFTIVMSLIAISVTAFNIPIALGGDPHVLWGSINNAPVNTNNSVFGMTIGVETILTGAATFYVEYY